jgi:hypothetical protein
MHPALRMKKAPAPKSANNCGSGRQPAGALKAIDQVQGQYNSQVPEKKINEIKIIKIKPIGLLALIKRKYELNFLEIGE